MMQSLVRRHSRMAPCFLSQRLNTRTYMQNKSQRKLLTKKEFLEDFCGRLEACNAEEDGGLFLHSCAQDVCDETAVGRADLLHYVWNELDLKGMGGAKVAFFNQYLALLVHERLDFDPIVALKELKGESANTTTTSLLIQAYAMRGNPGMVTKLLKPLGDHVEQDVYGWLAQAFIRNGEDNKAKIIIDAIKEKTKLGVPLYTPLINIHAEQGDLEKVERTIFEMVDANIRPTSQLYISLLEHLVIGKHTDLLEMTLDNIDGVQCLSEDFEPLVRRCVLRGDFAAADVFLNSVTNQPTTHLDSF